MLWNKDDKVHFSARARSPPRNRAQSHQWGFKPYLDDAGDNKNYEARNVEYDAPDILDDDSKELRIAKDRRSWLELP